GPPRRVEPATRARAIRALHTVRQGPGSTTAGTGVTTRLQPEVAGAMAWMAMLGCQSVEYHKAAVLERADDHREQTLGYYSSRGETPLVWGGTGAEGMGLTGTVTDVEYSRIFGVGGACDPRSGERLVRTRRPGLDLVISAHKSVAELGVIGRVDDMHAILD